MAEKNYGNNSQLAEIVKYISDNMKLPLIGAGGGFAPLGMYGFSCDYVLTPPQGWLFADGSIYNIADYPEYAALLTSQYGRANIYGGDGITTFATKDLRGEFIRGWGQNSHANQGSGANVGVHQDSTTILNGYMDTSNDAYIGFTGGGELIENKDSQRLVSTNWNFIKGTRNSEASRYKSAIRPTNTSVAFFVKATVSGDANAHVYSTDEQTVGTTEDGETIYEITKKNLSVLSVDNDWTNNICTLDNNANRIVDCILYTSTNTTIKPVEMRVRDHQLSCALVVRGQRTITNAVIQYTKTQS